MDNPSLLVSLKGRGLKAHFLKKIFHLMKILKRMNENMEFPGASGEDIEWLQDGFVTAIKVLSSGIEMTA